MDTRTASARLGRSVRRSGFRSTSVGVVGVQFQLDGTPRGAEDTSAPYVVSWNTTTVPAGGATLRAEARDGAGNRATSTAIVVTVANSGEQVMLAWDPNSEPDLAGYRVYVGTASGVYSTNIDAGNTTTYTRYRSRRRRDVLLRGHLV